MDKISIFFRHPSDFSSNVDICSTLYLLRRDIYCCFGINPNNNAILGYRVLLPGIISIMTGIDLLAKFYFSDTKRVGERFKKYVVKFINKKYSNELYQLRNSTIHSFGLFSEDNKGNRYQFILTGGKTFMIEKKCNSEIIVDIEILWKKFEESIELYKEELLNSIELRERFLIMYAKYGSIQIR